MVTKMARYEIRRYNVPDQEKFKSSTGQNQTLSYAFGCAFR